MVTIRGTVDWTNAPESGEKVCRVGVALGGGDTPVVVCNGLGIGFLRDLERGEENGSVFVDAAASGTVAQQA